jgi:7-cyano-7-deazaguanine reductase
MELKNLGKQTAHKLDGRDASLLEAIPNPMLSGHNNSVEIVATEFSALCPVTSGPDYGVITVTYIPNDLIVESKSLKYYLESYRGERIFHERVVSQICEDLHALLRPTAIKVGGEFNPRGGLAINPVASIGY